MGTERTILKGRYARRNETFLQKQAERDDPSRVFYAAMLAANTYEAYFARVGSILVEVAGLKHNPISARDEILYARRNRWIMDN